MFKKNKLTNKKENNNVINVNSNDANNIWNLILQELISINKTLSKFSYKMKDHEQRLRKLEKNGGRG